ncbi:hypothetical protein NDU88_008502 [Pleurodeles waltl]|uniref:S100P-binding protein n=1 Tax=Pleurodeles waltl TaxID=8319 RepID=A0AAV7NY08_PLEWA|nr:hypothetical protein NDU88_008502 [Pleurodeles waltl]
MQLSVQARWEEVGSEPVSERDWERIHTGVRMKVLFQCTEADCIPAPVKQAWEYFSTYACFLGSASSSGALDSNNVESTNTDVTKSPVMSQANTAVLSSVKKLGKVAPIPNKETWHRSASHVDLEWKKQIYLQCVLKHMRSTEDQNQDAYDELLMLMYQAASAEYKDQEQNWQHPSNLTTRNYSRCPKKLPNKYSLKQWVSQNGGY